MFTDAEDISYLDICSHRVHQPPCFNELFVQIKLQNVGLPGATAATCVRRIIHKVVDNGVCDGRRYSSLEQQLLEPSNFIGISLLAMPVALLQFANIVICLSCTKEYCDDCEFTLETCACRPALGDASIHVPLQVIHNQFQDWDPSLLSYPQLELVQLIRQLYERGCQCFAC